MNKALEELRALSDTELEDELKKAKEELFQLKFKHALKQLENTAKLGQLKHRIAQIKTVNQERLLNLRGAKNA
ncbi:MAG: 50S ribosomal protein L29 [Candidatus Sericytochromatia bacterium]|nr:MAG: 50S ribosomal protein L29 [Candidatus Sericytochromatia bacterium]